MGYSNDLRVRVIQVVEGGAGEEQCTRKGAARLFHLLGDVYQVLEADKCRLRKERQLPIW
jgi:hypothetical protein